jgi:hypothetical protein
VYIITYCTVHDPRRSSFVPSYYLPAVTAVDRSLDYTASCRTLPGLVCGCLCPQGILSSGTPSPSCPDSPGVQRQDHAALTVAAINLAPLVALAEGDYEYGAVDAHRLVLPLERCSSYLDGLLPVVMKGGEEAFREVRTNPLIAGKKGQGCSQWEQKVDGRLSLCKIVLLVS